MDSKEFTPFFRLLANESSTIIKRYFRTSINVENKADLSPVTIADKLAEEKMRELITREFPEHGIIGEEFGNEKSDSEYVWVLDPIDGTKSFISGALSFGTLIALLKNGNPILGAINHPILNEFLIGDSKNCFLNGKKAQVRKCSEISNATLLTTDHLNIGKFKNQKRFDRLTDKVKLYRNWGDCYDYYLLVTGYADIMIDPIMSVWDSMALIPIVNGAGGMITDYEGNDPVLGNSMVASTKENHSEIIKLLNG